MLAFVTLAVSAAVLVVHIIGAIAWLVRQRGQAKILTGEQQDFPPVSVLKPIKAVGELDALRASLVSFFQLDYPKFELVFCLENYQDEAYQLVRELMSAHPSVDARIEFGSQIGVNPKINNMGRAFGSLKYSLVWITDAGVQAQPLSLRVLAAEHQQGQGKLGFIHQLPLATRRNTFGSFLEEVYFSTQHAYIYMFADVIGANCVNGMSIFFSKKTFESVAGGLTPFANVLAEDFFMSKALYVSGYKHKVSCLPAWQTGSSPTTKTFFQRQIRWFRLRKGSMPLLTSLELLSESVPLALLCYLFNAGSMIGLGAGQYVFLFLFAWYSLDMSMLILNQNLVIRPTLDKIVLMASLVLREMTGPVVYVIGQASNRVRWHDVEYEIHAGGYTTLTTKQESN